MDKEERLSLAFDLKLPDRPPILGGWMASPAVIQQLTGCSADQYWSDPFRWGLNAERVLDSDGVIGVFEPVARGSYRCVDERDMAVRASYTIETVLQEIDALPDPDEVVASFDEEREYSAYIEEVRKRQRQCGDIVWCPADWKLIPHGLWYHEFGYETAMLSLAVHPNQYRKLIEHSARTGLQRARLRARAIREGVMPRAVLTGEDLCSQQGPMVAPEYLRREYFPLLEQTLEPLLQAGAQVVWHCDGAYSRLLDDVLACGVSGLQGFQRECGMELESIVRRRTRTGDPLLIFGPMSVTGTLLHGSTEDVRAEVQWAMDVCRDRASLVFFTSNTINPDIPPDNIRAFWDAVQNSRW
jgi:hypothetical protein